MATQEQMQLFGNTSSDSSTSDDSSDELTPVPMAMAPKLKLKLKFRLSAEKKAAEERKLKQALAVQKEANDDDDDGDAVMAEYIAPIKSSSPEPVEAAPVFVKSEEADDDDEAESVVVKAMVVGDDEEEDETTVVVEPVLSSTSMTTSSTSRVTSSNTHTKKRQSVRPIKMPAIASPGLLLANGTTTAAQFDHQMKLAGYTLETRVDNPHRGSSTKRQVDDMFDSSVQLHRNFPKLVPPELIADATESGAEPKLVQMLKNGLKDPSISNKRKKRRFDEMIPLSLKIDYPADFIEKRQEYVKKVKEREDAIVESQEADLEDRPPVKVPPIPTPPEAPHLEEHQQGLDLKDKHPLYPSKNDAFVKHLDQACFHASEGRYVGLSSNSISDPHYVGAHAVGVSNLSVTAGTGLATTQTGSTSAGSASLASTVYGDRSSKGTVDVKSTSNGTNNGMDAENSKDSTSTTSLASNKTPKGKSPAPSKKKKSSSPAPKPGSSADLKRIMESEMPETEDMRKCILRAGVYASRTGRHGQSFLGPDGNVYADVSKTFAAYAGVKPCPRCKNNKQGAYHCRLKRKHKDADHDGGDSLSLLTPLFEEPVESLIIKAK